ncbi:MAG TPA: hypothetical protein DCS55_23915 [Acidimicrobiaceae bacterium]|nr:hypothetical protein [Acidimicrobiaceae bacterium]
MAGTAEISQSGGSGGNPDEVDSKISQEVGEVLAEVVLTYKSSNANMVAGRNSEHQALSLDRFHVAVAILKGDRLLLLPRRGRSVGEQDGCSVPGSVGDGDMLRSRVHEADIGRIRDQLLEHGERRVRSREFGDDDRRNVVSESMFDSGPDPGDLRIFVSGPDRECIDGR